MKTSLVVRGVGLCILLLANVGCDGGGDEAGGPVAVAGSSGSGGSGGGAGGSGGGSGSGGGGTLPEGVALTPANGWVDGASNTIGVQGAIFSYADDTSKAGPPALTDDFTGSKACMKGTAAKVNLTCTPPAGEDCYGMYWGAAIGLNLNQPIDTATGKGGTPAAYDAKSAGLSGFAFMVEGTTVPTGMRFKIEDGTTEYCTRAVKNIKTGANIIHFSDLYTECWKTTGQASDAAGATSKIIKIAWHVVTNDSAAVPFDFCVSDIRALQPPN